VYLLQKIFPRQHETCANPLASKIRTGEIAAVAAVDAYIARIEQVNPALNALVVSRYDEARAEARDVDRRRAAGEPLGPLAGVPVTIKECLDLAGTPSTFGLPSRKDRIVSHDEKHVARLRRAGAIVLGKTNVARGSVPLGQRTVASQVGVIGRTVGDVTLGLEVINGGNHPAPDDSLAAAMPLGDPLAVDISKLRVAYYVDDGTFTPAPAVRRAVRESAHALESRGATVQAWSPPDVARARDLFFGILVADGFAGLHRSMGRDRRDPRIAKIEMAARAKAVADLVLGLSGRGRLKREVVANYGYSDTHHYWQLVEAVIDYRERFLEAARGFDVILCPATALPAFRHGAAEELVLAGAYTCLYNVLGWPAGVAPVIRVRADEESDRSPSRDKMDLAALETERGSVGLPIAVQVAARPWREDLVLATLGAIAPMTAAPLAS
jgi:Asp-tRNA(Asn)/Glu-tRNA(Gln) amidotransferase A subunit family amidase